MKKIIIFNLIIGCFFFSCTKEEGEGGSSSIQGTVYKLATYQNASTGTIDTLYYQVYTEKEVYIIYSSNEDDMYDDSFDTHWNGEYKFEHLRQGYYTIFTYADSTDANGIEYEYPVFRHIDITKNNKAYTLEDFVIIK